MKEKQFILGLGAQKCGTSWLYRYIEASETSRMGPRKEYHIWDGIYIDDFSFFRANPIKELFFRKPEGIKYGRKVQIHRFLMQNLPGYYENYFNALLKDGGHITGDITPSYSSLREKQLKHVSSRLKKKGFKTKVVFLMRDPFERCWSSSRFTQRIDGVDNRKNQSESELLATLYQSSRFKLRTNYNETIEAIESVFHEEQVYFGFFETMFTEREIIRLSNFLSISPNLSFASREVNATPKTTHVDEKLKKEIILYYKHVYEFCKHRFPIVESIWSESFRLL